MFKICVLSMGVASAIQTSDSKGKKAAVKQIAQALLGAVALGNVVTAEDARRFLQDGTDLSNDVALEVFDLVNQVRALNELPSFELSTLSAGNKSSRRAQDAPAYDPCERPVDQVEMCDYANTFYNDTMANDDKCKMDDRTGMLCQCFLDEDSNEPVPNSPYVKWNVKNLVCDAFRCKSFCEDGPSARADVCGNVPNVDFATRYGFAWDPDDFYWNSICAYGMCDPWCGSVTPASPSTQPLCARVDNQQARMCDHASNFYNDVLGNAGKCKLDDRTGELCECFLTEEGDLPVPDSPFSKWNVKNLVCDANMCNKYCDDSVSTREDVCSTVPNDFFRERYGFITDNNDFYWNSVCKFNMCDAWCVDNLN